MIHDRYESIETKVDPHHCGEWRQLFRTNLVLTVAAEQTARPTSIKTWSRHEAFIAFVTLAVHGSCRAWLQRVTDIATHATGPELFTRARAWEERVLDQWDRRERQR